MITNELTSQSIDNDDLKYLESELGVVITQDITSELLKHLNRFDVELLKLNIAAYPCNRSRFIISLFELVVKKVYSGGVSDTKFIDAVIALLKRTIPETAVEIVKLRGKVKKRSCDKSYLEEKHKVRTAQHHHSDEAMVCTPDPPLRFP